MRVITLNNNNTIIYKAP